LKLSEIGEFGFIDRITPKCITRTQGLIQGIGDDAAVLEKDSRSYFLVTTDLLVEDVHFLKQKISPWQLGWKSLAVNLSDIAAMGGIAREAFLSLGIPPNMDVEFWDEFYRGFKELASQWKVNLSGGDTTGSKGPIVVSVTVVGEVLKNEVIYRRGAQPGDHIVVTGNLGDSGAGLDILLQNDTISESEYASLVKIHHEPIPHLMEGRWLAQTGSVTAMIDISDGLAQDLGHICDLSSVGAKIDLGKIPLSETFTKYVESRNRNRWELSLGAGEDYVLLCTIKNDRFPEIRQAWETHFRRPLFEIGVIEEVKGIRYQKSDGTFVNISKAGFDHFVK
jgi:thiamine-monophosphate kinase